MNVRTVSDDPRWYAVHTRPRQEGRAESNLRAWGVEIFAPSIKERRRGRAYGSTHVFKLLFPGYLFAHFDAGRMLHKVSFTRGVNKVVNVGGEPAAIDDSVIELIQSRAGEDGYIKLGEHFEAGDKVLIKDGPFAKLVGVFERKIKSSDRVMILLEAVQYQSHVLVNIEQVKKM
ncbi:MAG: transcription termination/antitermination NusG family protein [Pyrinomonadaceae bacterium]